MWLLGVQFRNLGVLGDSNAPIAMDLRDPDLPLIDQDMNRELPVVLTTGLNFSGKTTLIIGVYFALNGRGRLNNRSIPKEIFTMGTSEMTVALTVRHSGQASRLSGKNRSYYRDRITLVRTAYDKPSGIENKFFIIDGFHNLADPFPYGSNVSQEEYRQILETFGINQGVLHAYEETLEQGSISNLAHAMTHNNTYLFDLLCRVVGASNARKNYEIKFATMQANLLNSEKEQKHLDEKHLEYERMERKKIDFERLTELNTRHETQKAEQIRQEAIHQVARTKSYELRIAMLRRSIAEKESESKQLSLSIKNLESDSFRIGQEHNAARGQMAQVERDLSLADSRLGQCISMRDGCQATIDGTPASAISKSVEEWNAEYETYRVASAEAYNRMRELKHKLEEVEGQIAGLLSQASSDRFPQDVQEFICRLTERGIDHQILADVLTIKNEDWYKPIEAYLGNRRFWVMIPNGKNDFDEAYRLVRELHYQPGICGPRSRHNRSPESYKGTVWEMLDLIPDALRMWGYHLDPLGYQLIARSPEEARSLSVKRPEMTVFDPGGVISVPDLYARSIFQRRNQDIQLYCGKRAVELELIRLTRLKAEVGQEYENANFAQENARQEERACEQLLNACKYYYAAQDNLNNAETILAEAEAKRVKLQQSKVDWGKKVDNLRDQLETIRSAITQIDPKMKQLAGQISSDNNALRSYSSPPTSSGAIYVPVAKLEEARQYVDQIQADLEDDEQRVTRLENTYREASQSVKSVGDEIRNTEHSIAEIPEAETLDATIIPRCEYLKTLCLQIEQALEEVHRISMASTTAAKTEYLLLKQEMTRAVSIVEKQANLISQPLQVEFRFNLQMPDGGAFDVVSPERDALDQLYALHSMDKQVMGIDVKVRFDKDLRRDFRPISGGEASGGQREIACTALLGGILFAAQQMDSPNQFVSTGWEKAPLLLLDEPFKNLDMVNRKKLIGSMLMLPVQMVVLYPDPPKDFIDACDVVIAVMKTSDPEKQTQIKMGRGYRKMSRTELAMKMRGDDTHGMAA
jgi:DNA repair exonuclease SbcCD ATPase subunit